MRYLIALLALAGMIDSYLALRIHNEDPSVAPPCAVTAHFDCGTVNHGKYSVFPPPPSSFDEAPGTHHTNIPVAAVGMGGYALILILALAGARLWIILQAAEIGFFCAAILSYLEAFVIQVWCIYCLWSQCIIATILLLTIVAMYLEYRRKRYAHNTETSAVVIAHK